MIDQLNQLYEEFKEKIAAVEDMQQLDSLKTLFLGKKGPMTDILKGLKDVAPDMRKEVGMKGNEIKQGMTAAIEARRDELKQAAINEKISNEWLDVTLNEADSNVGGLHPVSVVQYEIEDIFTSMGFTVLDGPHIETDYYNFEALNIPADHPARDMQDTFYFENGAILRTHTSAIQVRGMEKATPPFKVIGPGKVFRVERPDATHEAAFHQLEGMVVGEDINVSHLINTMKTLLSEIFKRDVDVRLRPGFFPFVEPGFELDISCQLCNGKGCSVCKNVGWIELMPCGMVHPNVLKSGGIDPEKYSGFAFGLGLDRLVMMRYKIEDIRHLHSGDIRFSGKFK
ncbi:MAG: phenylalanine--tRNA ligase subunit alpha [Lentisphaeraceae bacterium]|nr:phenylalanine--tRNA ligase subunit alpha [Lentisphaeraceae bacterium]